MKLVFFDIDGTLIHCDRAGRNSLSAALKKLTKIEEIPQSYSLSGKTDTQILKEVLQLFDMDQTSIDNIFSSILDEYYEILKLNLEDSIYINKKILPGIIQLLDSLADMKDQVILGLVTGNLRRTARLKLEHFNIHHYFVKDNELFGGFGSDHFERARIVDIAVERARETFEKDFTNKDIVIIGDSNHDVLCGKHLNVKSIAVATGEWSMERLADFKPDYLFSDFTNKEKVINSILE